MEVECPGCSAKFRAPQSVKTFTCPYCGLVFGERAREDHYYFPIMNNEPYALLLNFLRRQFGIPSDIASSSSLHVRQLHYVPVYFYYLYGRMIGRCSGKGWTEAEEAVYRGVVASRFFRDILEDYPFPVRGKKFFREEIMNMGVYHSPEFSELDARNYVENMLYRMLKDELSRECKNVSEIRVEELKIDFRGLIHYPIYCIEYSYNRGKYTAYIDGVDGKVISAEYPIKLQTKTLQITVSLTLLMLGAFLGLSLSFMLWNPVPFIFSMIPAIGSSIPLLRRSLTKKVKSSEVKMILEEPRPLTAYIRKFLR
jgi:hypothetical protein